MTAHWSAAQCAPPEQAGSYEGKGRTEVSNLVSGSRFKEKVEVAFTLNADDSFSFSVVSETFEHSIQGTVANTVMAIGAQDRVLHRDTAGNIVTIVIHFQKNGTIKGHFHSTESSIFNTIRETRFALKKAQP